MNQREGDIIQSHDIFAYKGLVMISPIVGENEPDNAILQSKLRPVAATATDFLSRITETK